MSVCDNRDFRQGTGFSRAANVEESAGFSR